MSTDDLIQRARDWNKRYPQSQTAALVVGLADEVDRLRAREVLHSEDSETSRRIEEAQLQRIIALEDERDEARAEADRFRTLWDRYGKNDLLAERDAARVALGRVRAWANEALNTAPNNDWGWGYVQAGAEALAALEGKP